MSRQVFKYCKVQEKVVPIEDAIESNIHLHIVSDEMPPTRNPLNSKEIFTSKSKLRAEYKRAGVEEVGTAYDNGYRPEKLFEDRTRDFNQRQKETIIRNVRGRE